MTATATPPAGQPEVQPEETEAPEVLGEEAFADDDSAGPGESSNPAAAPAQQQQLPTAVDGVVRCPNPSCVTNHDPVTPRVRVDSTDPVRLRCHYCERRIRYDEVEFLPAPQPPR